MLFAFVLSLAACGDAANNQNPANQNNVTDQYVKQEYPVTQYEFVVPAFGSFMIEYPEDWKRVENQEDNSTVLILEVGNDQEIMQFTMTHDAAFYKAFEDSFTKSGVLIADNGVQATIYIDANADSSKVIRAFDFNPGTDSPDYYFVEINMSKAVYDANKEKILNTLKSYRIR
jgi:hypothetical protein